MLCRLLYSGSEDFIRLKIKDSNDAVAVKFMGLYGTVGFIAIRDGWSGLPFHSFRRGNNGFK